MTTTGTRAAIVRPGRGGYLLFAPATVWMIAVTIIIQFRARFTDQVILIRERPLPWLAWLLISWGHALLLALPLVPLAIYTRTPRFRAI